MCSQFQPMRFNVGSDGILLLAQSNITSLVLLPLLLQVHGYCASCFWMHLIFLETGLSKYLVLFYVMLFIHFMLVFGFKYNLTFKKSILTIVESRMMCIRPSRQTT